MLVHSELTSLVQVADLIAYIVSWAVRTPAREELGDLADAVRLLRWKTTVTNVDGELERWSFVFLDDGPARRRRQYKMKKGNAELLRSKPPNRI